MSSNKNRKSTGARAKRVANKTERSANAPITFTPGKGLMVSTSATYPQSVRDKVITAKSIAAALSAAAETNTDIEFEPAWVMDMLIALLDQAAEQIEHEDMERRRASTVGAQ
jgi:hypothetical protein